MRKKCVALCLVFVILFVGCGEQPERVVTNQGLPVTDAPATAIPTLAPMEGNPIGEAVKESVEGTPPAPKGETTVGTVADADEESAGPNAFVNVPNIETNLTGEPGPACFGSGGHGLACLSAEGEWRTYTSDNSALRSDFIADMDVCVDGKILVAHAGGIAVVQDGELVNLGGGWDGGGADGVACAESGDIWVAHFEGASHWNGDVWTTYSAENFSKRDEFSALVEDVAISDDGNVWVATANSIATFDGTDWAFWQNGQGFEKKYFFEDIFVDTENRPIAVHSNGLLLYEDDVWINLENGTNFVTVQGAAADVANNLWLAAYDDGLIVYDGQKWGGLTTANSGLRVDNANSVAFDAGGRLWVGTVYGLHVFDGKEWTIYDMDSAEILANDYDSIAVVHGGPKLPAPQDRVNGSLTGAIVRNNAALADARIEICPLPVYFNYYGATPCSDQPIMFSTMTNADGNFEVADVPVGNYIITIQVGESDWAQLTPDLGIGSELVYVPEAETVDIGSLVIGQ